MREEEKWDNKKEKDKEKEIKIEKNRKNSQR